MKDKMLMFFPNLTKTKKSNRSGGPGNYHFPSKGKQAGRVETKFKKLEESFNKKAELKTSISGAVPEQVLVFEIVGTIEEFMNAVKRIEGFEWLSEWEEEFLPDEDFFDMDNQEKEVKGRLFLILSEMRALNELRSLWNKYQKDEEFEHGTGKFKQLFKQLRDIRPWGVKDRLEDTGILEDWKYRLKAGEETINFEVELWYRDDNEKRNKASKNFKAFVNEANGRVLKEVIIEEIKYHSFLINAPITIFEDLSESDNVSLIRSDYIMFFRPVGQVMFNINYFEEELTENTSFQIPYPSKNEPVVALLDGLPLQNHDLLKNHLIIDDPDDFENDYKASERQHGTCMASLILHGDLNNQQVVLDRPIYVRPIMKPNHEDFNQIRSECIPRSELPIDIVHRAVKRMFDGDNGIAPTAPSVKIVNLSIGDESRQFDFVLSPWARLIDWLSLKYNVLFIISAGNFKYSMVFDLDRDELPSLTPNDYENLTLKSILNSLALRRILSPAESVNSLTIGAIHNDSYNGSLSGRLIDPIPINTLSSPISRVGLGFRRSIKPELYLPGGKQVYLENSMGNNGKAQLDLRGPSSIPPGQKVAFPGQTGGLSNTIFTCGTSNSTALCTRLAAQIIEYLESTKATGIFSKYIDESTYPLIIKSLLVHQASWGNAYTLLRNSLKDPNMKEDVFKDKIASRFLGFGFLNENTVLNFTDQKATVIGIGKINKGEGNIFELPLPPSLASKKEWRRLTITLSWFTPINPVHQKYRRALLWFDPPVKGYENLLGVSRKEAQWQAVRRGTVQHEILEGNNATPFIDGDTVKIQVNCDEDAGKLKESVTFALVITLEVSETVKLPIYEEIFNRIKPRVQIRPTEKE